VSLILVEVDAFAELVERHGARFGDAVLKRFSEIVREALRKEDLVVRFAAAQLLIVLPDIQGPGAVVVRRPHRREVEEKRCLRGADRRRSR
jgi:diguanylate cyclase (GGDEF)-like protein